MNLHLDPSLSAPSRTLPAQISPHAKASLERLEHLQELLAKTKPALASTLAWDRFLALPEERQLQIQQSWDTQSALLEAAMRAGVETALEGANLRFALAHLGLELAPEVLAAVGNDDTSELTDWNALPAYRSLRHFCFARYSQVELAATPWNDLYDRSGAEGDFLMREKLTEEKRSFRLRVKMRVRLASKLTGEPFTLVVYSAHGLHN